MRIFIPFTNLRAETFVAAPGAILVPTIGKFGYSNYLEQRWTDGKTFINIEHDVVPTTEILESLWDCKSPLCVTGHSDVPGCPEASYLACVKISSDFIAQRRIDWRGLQWFECDQQLWKSDPEYSKSGDHFCYHGTVKHLH
jgi:hypothetical protein